MVIFASIVALTLGCLAVVIVSLRLPWPQRVRWLVANNALGYWGMPTEPIQMREVFVVDVCHDDHELSVVVRAPGSAQPDTELVLAGAATASSVAHTARWRAAGTPLLLVSNGPGALSLHGPSQTVCGFERRRADTPPEPPTTAGGTTPSDRQEDALWFIV